MKFFKDKQFTTVELFIVLFIILLCISSVAAFAVLLFMIFGKDIVVLLMCILVVAVIAKIIYK